MTLPTALLAVVGNCPPTEGVVEIVEQGRRAASGVAPVIFET